MEQPLISVVVPAYNAASTLAATLDSVLAQTYENIEVLVVDDGSTDATAGITRAWVRRDARVRLLEQPNGGVASARNHGLAAARGDYVAPIDADDLWHPTKLAKQMCVMLAGGPGMGLVYALFRAIDEQGVVLWTQTRFQCEGSVLARHVYANFVSNGSSLLLRKAAALAVGGYDVGLRAAAAQGCEDYLLQLQIAARYRFGCVPEYLVGYRQVAGSMSSNTTQMRRSHRLMLDRIRTVCPALPRRLFRWSLANYDMRLAGMLMRDGRIAQALRRLGCAAVSDPVGIFERLCLSSYGVRLVSSGLLQYIRGAQPVRDSPKAARPAFLSIDPGALGQPGPGGLMRRRLQQLADVDQRLIAAD